MWCHCYPLRWGPALRDRALLDRTLRYLLDHIELYGPFDGLWGFSEGAAVVALLSTPSVRHRLGRPARPSWRFAVLACGATVHELHDDHDAHDIHDAHGAEEAREEGERPLAKRDTAGIIPTADDANDSGIMLPSLHLIGARDPMRPLSERLASRWNAPTVHHHALGHEVH